jgi:hypothetical protein
MPFKRDHSRRLLTFAKAMRTGQTDAERKLWHLLRPKKYGGQELRPDVMYEVAGELARGDGSVAWVYAVMSIHDLFMGYFPEEAQAEYWAKDVISSSSFMPGGKATATRGGYNVTGKWSFCSGIDNSQWMLLGCVFGMLDMQPPMPDVRFVMVPTADCKIIDDFYHQQITEGNLIPNVEAAWDEIAAFHIGDNPGRFEPTTGEINYRNLFKWIHQKGYQGVLCMEHGQSKPRKEGEQADIDAYRVCDQY